MFDHHIFRQVAVAEMMLALERADAAAVVAALSRLDQMLTPTDFPLLVQALLAEAQVMFGKPEHALTIVQNFMAQAPPDNVFATALGSRIKGLAQQALGQTTEALAYLDQAIRAFESAAMPFDATRASLEWATLAAATDGAAAAQALQESLAVFERLGARRYARRARRLLYKLGIRPSSTLRTRPSATPLSPRELEIVLLVADDMTNVEIAERLIISPRTVTTHLDRIYTRLGINSRTALVRYAIEAGLLPPKH
jgi:DNA-binding CsgD family transcriptional regulator